MSRLDPRQAATKLQAARLALDWTQAKVIHELVAEAKLAKIPIAELSSLKTMLSRWENGVMQPDADYQQLFCAIYSADPDELGFVTLQGGVRLPQVAPILDGQTVDYFRNVFWQHVQADNLMGPHHLVDAVRAQAALLDRVLADAKHGVLPELSRLAFQYNEFAGWLYQDAGDPHEGMHFTDRAMDYVVGGGTPTELAYLLMRKTNIANDEEHVSQALSLSDAGLRDAGRVAPRVRALVLSQRARAHAIEGNADAFRRAVDDATREVARGDHEEDGLAAYCTPAYIQMEAAASWTTLGRPELAVPILREALNSWSPAMRRDLGLCQARMAIAQAKLGDVSEACRAGFDAVQTASAATSTRTLRDLRRLREVLAPWRRDGEVSELTCQIRALVRAA